MSLLTEVPKTLAANLIYRDKLLANAEHNVPLQQAIIAECKHDILFWLNATCWIFEPRSTKDDSGKKLPPRKLPFVTWPHQDVAIQKILEEFGSGDIVIDKSRTEGASWVVLMIYLYYWLFHPMSLLGITSRTMAAADNGKQGSLMGKICWALEQLPVWMIPRYERLASKNTLENLDNGSCITAHACTDDMAVGDRYLSFFMDELSRFQTGDDYTAWTSTQAVTDCRIACGTPFGPDGQYFDLVHEPDLEITRVVLDWKDNPTKNRGMYRLIAGRVVEKDPLGNPLPKDYVERCKEIHARLTRMGFTLEDKDRTPWYDRQCLRYGSPQKVAQELDRNFTGTSWPYMNPQLISEIQAETIRPPYVRGYLTFDQENLEPTWHEKNDGPLLLWVNLTVEGIPPLGRYAQGSDVSYGTAGAFSSLSTTVGFNTNTGEQAYEFTSRDMKPEVFARYNIALAKFFHNAILNWEANGPGVNFTNEVIRFTYGFAHQRETKEEHGPKTTSKLGTHMQNNKIDVLGGSGSGVEGFADAVESRRCIIRSADLLLECGQYMFKFVGNRLTIAHISDTQRGKGKSGGKDHGDRVVGAALGWLSAANAPKPKNEEDITDKIPFGSLQWRINHAAYLAAVKEEDANPWDF